MIVALIGGLGIFLLGMVLLTDGLKAMAGAALRGILTRMVASPASGVGWGALVTTIVQSSTATTLTTVGFVSAGLLTFSQAVGVVFGANLGTTSTGWIVSQLGFKVSLGSISPPLILLGVAMRLLSKGRLAHAGTAIAGFGLLFVGIDMLQHGMGSVASHISPDDLPGGGLAGRAVLVGIGLLMTVLMQSSSASMTTTLAAVATGAIGIDQAAAIVVGQNLGNTPTPMIASIGAPAAAKRTALAHMLFNAITAFAAFLALPLLLGAARTGASLLGANDAPTILAVFHTVFNILGVALLLPMVGPFSRLIERIIPERGPPATRYLAPAVAEVGPVALEAARRALSLVLRDAASEGRTVLRAGSSRRTALAQSHAAVVEVRKFVHRLGRDTQHPTELHRQNALFHACDHLDRLIEDLHTPPAGVRERASHEPVEAAAKLLSEALDKAGTIPEPQTGAAPPGPGQIATLAAALEALSVQVAALRKRERRRALFDAAAGRIEPDAAVARVDGLLWVDTVAYHLWRAARYLTEQPPADDPDSPADATRPPSPIQ